MKTKRLLYVAALLAFAATTFGASSAKPAKLSGQPSGAEIAFVHSMQTDLMSRFAKASDAEKAGYIRYTDEDSTGAISYANLQWQSADAQHPSQLWYDLNGNLLGADFSQVIGTVPSKAPHLWGVNPRRWMHFRAHIHYILKNADGSLKYGGMGMKKFLAAGGSATDPQIATLVAMGTVKEATQVMRLFLFPQEWDLIVWVKANPNGAFAEMNPLVHPSANAAKEM